MRSTARSLRYVKWPLAAAVLLGVFAAGEAASADSAAIPRPPELEQDVKFWTRVYSEISTSEGFVHDERNLAVVYAKMKFAPDTTSRDKQQAIDDVRDRYAASLRRVATFIAQRERAGAAPNGAAAAADATTANASTAGSAASPDDSLSEDDQRVLAMWGNRVSSSRLLEASRMIRFQLGQADRFRAGLIRSGTWETHIAETFANLGLPAELAALPHVESSFNPAAYSKVGAAGLWQFMRSTGRRYMRVDDLVDERLDPFRATEAAAQLLSYNHRLLGTWPLAMTAYNHGAAGMRRAAEATGTSDFVTIARTYNGRTFGFASRNFYPSFLAALEIDRAPEKFFGPIERAPEMRFQEVELPGYVLVSDVERSLGVSQNVLRELNPALRPLIWSGARMMPRGYRLRLPDGEPVWSAAKLLQALGPGQIYASQVLPRTHRVGRGDSLASIARRYGISTSTLARLNGLATDSALRRGRVLQLPEQKPPLLAAASAAAVSAAAASPIVPGTAAARATTSDAPASFYVVREGDTLEAIAARVGLPVRQLMQINRLKDPDFVFEGQRLLTRPLAIASADAAATPPSASETDETDAADEAGDAAQTQQPQPSASGSRAATVARREAPAAATAAVRPATTAATTAATSTRAASPTSIVLAEAQGPAVGPSGGTAVATEFSDLSVRSDGSIRVIAEETLGQYAEWLNLRAARLRDLNGLKRGQPVLLGHKLRLDFSRVTHADFEQKRSEFHARLQAAFFDDRRIVGTEIYIVRRGDTLWQLSQKFAGVPVWLVQQYNPDVDLGHLRPGVELVVPRIEDANGAATGRAAIETP